MINAQISNLGFKLSVIALYKNRSFNSSLVCFIKKHLVTFFTAEIYLELFSVHSDFSYTLLHLSSSLHSCIYLIEPRVCAVS